MLIPYWMNVNDNFGTKNKKDLRESIRGLNEFGAKVFKESREINKQLLADNKE